MAALFKGFGVSHHFENLAEIALIQSSSSPSILSSTL